MKRLTEKKRATMAIICFALGMPLLMCECTSLMLQIAVWAVCFALIGLGFRLLSIND